MFTDIAGFLYPFACAGVRWQSGNQAGNVHGLQLLPRMQPIAVPAGGLGLIQGCIATVQQAVK